MKPIIWGMVALAGASTTTTAAQAQAQTQMGPERRGVAAGDVLLRVRGILVAPNEESSGITPAFPGERAEVGDSLMPEIDVTYMASDRVGFELIASTTRHEASGVTGTTGAIGKLASTWVLPPTLTAQYRFNPTGAVRPYVGAGVNYTVFWNEKASDGLRAAVGRTDVRLSNSFGWAAQAGLDVDVSPRLFLNLDVKFIDIDTTARFRTAAAGEQRVRLDLDPLVVGVGVGIRL